MDEKNYFIERLTFSSDEIESEFTLIDKKNKTERELTFGYHVFDPFGEFKNSVILFKNICDKKSRVVFSIISLDKGYLKVQFEQRHTSDGINISTGIMTFERTAGPPENMP